MKQDTFITKYKPYSLSAFYRDNEGIEIARVLQTFLKIDDLNLLIVGDSNSGKTTLLYALLREYYGLRPEDNIPETNIMVINNLKEQGINNYRNEMKTFCQSHCTIPGKKKIILVDDIDMVYEQSQQVFRNYIDKYSRKVHFMAACSNIQKVIESLQSRLHIVKIIQPSIEKINTLANYIIEENQIHIEKDAVDYLIHRSNHSIRNVINNLEKIWIYSRESDIHIDKPTCENLCSTISFYYFDQYLDALVNKKDLNAAIKVFYHIYDYGYSVIDILNYFFIYVKTCSLCSESDKYEIIPFLCKYITVFHNTHENNIELALFTNDLYKNIWNIREKNGSRGRTQMQ